MVALSYGEDTLAIESDVGIIIKVLEIIKNNHQKIYELEKKQKTKENRNLINSK